MPSHLSNVCRDIFELVSFELAACRLASVLHSKQQSRHASANTAMVAMPHKYGIAPVHGNGLLVSAAFITSKWISNPLFVAFAVNLRVEVVVVDELFKRRSLQQFVHWNKFFGHARMIPIKFLMRNELVERGLGLYLLCSSLSLIILIPMSIQLTYRDQQALLALQKLPLTSQQLFRLSQTFSHSFPSERVLRRRMRRLEEEEIVRRYYYAFPSAGRNPAYWRLTRQSYRLINGLTGEDPLPRKSFFAPMGVSLHFHTHCVSEVLVEMLIQAHQHGIEIVELSVESSLELNNGDYITPDATIELQLQNGRRNRFLLEIDTASERVATKQRLPSSIQKKLEYYERYRLTNPDPFRVLFVTTSSKQRASNILRFGAGLTNNRAAHRVYAAFMPELVNSKDCLTDQVFANHQLQPISLINLSSVGQDAIMPNCDRIMAHLSQKEFTPVWSTATIDNRQFTNQRRTKSPRWQESAIVSG